MSNDLLFKRFKDLIPDGYFRDTESARILDGLLHSIADTRAVTWNKILGLKSVFNAVKMPDEWLESFGETVGISKKLAGYFTEADMRRLVEDAIPTWRAKGTDPRSAVERLTGANASIVDWFRWRIDLGVSELPWTSLTHGLLVASDENTVDVAVEDFGSSTVNRMGVMKLLQALRPVGEAFLVSFVRLLEDFVQYSITDSRPLVWWRWTTSHVTAGNQSIVLGDGAAIGSMRPVDAILPAATSQDYSTLVYAQGESGAPNCLLSISLYRNLAADDAYVLRLYFDGVASVVDLRRFVGGAPVLLDTQAYDLFTGSWYRIETNIDTQAGQTNIQLLIDGNPVINYADIAAARLSEGSAAWSSGVAGSDIEINYMAISNHGIADLFAVTMDGIYERVPLGWSRIG